MIKDTRLALALWVCVGLHGCAGLDRAGIEEYHRGDLVAAMKRFKQAAERDERNIALHLDDYGTAAMLAGEREEAKRAFLIAGKVMGNFDTTVGEELETVLVSESRKTYRGDPYEKAMNSFYAGLLFYQDGEYDTALAGFKSAALADSGTFAEWEGVDDPQGGESYECDNALVLMMEGKCYRKIGEQGNAALAFQTAQASLRMRGIENRYLRLLETEDPNTTFFVEIGNAPRKVRDGRHESAVRFVPTEYPECAAEILVDGASLGGAALIEDLYFQASTQGGRQMDSLLAGKAVFKDITLIGGYHVLLEAERRGKSELAAIGALAMLLGFLVDSSADDRHWETLPGRILVLLADLEPGRHDVTVRFFDARGVPVPGLRQEWKGLVVDPDRENLFVFRSSFGPEAVASRPAEGAFEKGVQ